MATKQLIEELTYQRDLWKADCLKLEAEVRILKDEDNRLLHEVDRLTQYAEEERSARHTAENFQMKYAEEFRRLQEEIETLKQWIKDAKCALNGER